MVRSVRRQLPADFKETAPSRGQKESVLLIYLLMVAMGFLFSVAMFRGLEYHSSYFGNSYQAIYPASFPRDPFMSPGRPTMVSLYYVLVKFIGLLWLDDRFTILVFAGMAMVSLIGLDKIIRLFGAYRLTERVTLLSIMLLEHRFLSNHALFLDNYDFNPTALACPVIIWLLYHSLAGSHPITVLSFAVLAALISPKNAWLPVLLSLLLLWKVRLDVRGKIWSGFAVFSFLILALFGYYLFVRPTDPTQPALFDFILRYMDNREANPFWDPLLANLLFLTLCLAGLILSDLPAKILGRVRVVAGCGLAVWLLGGLYLSYVPDAFKIPYLVPFDVTRALAWPQLILFMSISVCLLKRLQNARSGIGLFISWFLLLTLILIHVEFRAKLLAVILLITLAMLWSYRRQWRLGLIAPNARLIIMAVSVCVGTLSLYGVGAIHRRQAALKHLICYGIMGDNPGAKWVGVNEYIRSKTPLSATVFTFSIGQEGEIDFDGSLRTRTGRSMPIGHRTAFQFDYRRLLWLEIQQQHLQKFRQAWEKCDWKDASTELTALGSPDYLVISTKEAQWLKDVPFSNYTIEAVVGHFSIFRKLSIIHR